MKRCMITITFTIFLGAPNLAAGTGKISVCNEWKKEEVQH